MKTIIAVILITFFLVLKAKVHLKGYMYHLLRYLKKLLPNLE